MMSSEKAAPYPGSRLVRTGISRPPAAAVGNQSDQRIHHHPAHLPHQLPLAGDKGCYAEADFHTRLHWDRLSRGESGLTAAFIKQVAALPAWILFRHCVAGDQWPDTPEPLRTDQALLLQLARANAI
jgi:hypothetical protein